MQELFGDTVGENAEKVVEGNPLKKQEMPSLEFLLEALREFQPKAQQNDVELRNVFTYMGLSYGYSLRVLRGKGIGEYETSVFAEKGKAIVANNILWADAYAQVERIIENSRT